MVTDIVMGVPALRCLGVISGAGGLPRRLDFSCVCAMQVPVVHVVGAVIFHLCLVTLVAQGAM